MSAALPVTQTLQGLVLAVRVTPKSAKEAIAGIRIESDGRPVLSVRLTAPPVEGAANTALIAFLAHYWRLPKRSVKLLSGKTARIKYLSIETDPALAKRITQEIGALLR